MRCSQAEHDHLRAEGEFLPRKSLTAEILGLLGQKGFASNVGRCGAAAYVRAPPVGKSTAPRAGLHSPIHGNQMLPGGQDF